MKNKIAFKICVFALLLTIAQSADATYYFRYDGGNYDNANYASGYYAAQSLASPLSVSCAPIQSTAHVGEIVAWYASVTGGSADNKYNWNGSDGLSGNLSTAQKAYSATGEKFATVTVTSGTQNIMKGCGESVFIIPAVQTAPAPTAIAAPKTTAAVASAKTVSGSKLASNSLQSLCSASRANAKINDSVLWSVAVNGGNGNYKFEWYGSDGLSGTNATASKVYKEPGKKNAIAVISSGSEKTIADCGEIVIERSSCNGLLASVFRTGIDSPFLLVLLALGAVGIAIFLAQRKKTSEETAKNNKH